MTRRRTYRPALFLLVFMFVATGVATGCADSPIPPGDAGGDGNDAGSSSDTGRPRMDTGYAERDADVSPTDAAEDSDVPDTTDAGDSRADGVDTASSDASDVSTGWTSSPSIDWTKLVGASGTETPSTVVSSPSGAIYVGGWTKNALYGGSFSGGDFDGFIVKYNARGSRAWTRLPGSSGDDGVTDLAVDGTGTLFVGGETDRDIFGRKGKGRDDGFVATYDASGTRNWMRYIGSSDWEDLEAIDVAPSGALYAVGYSGSGLYGRRYNGGRWDAYVVKFGPGGNREWTRMIGTAGPDYGYAVTVDASNNVYVGGQALGPLHGESYTDGGDAFVVKYDSTGHRVWTRLFGGTYLDEVLSLSFDGAGHLYVSGQTGADLFGRTGAGSQDGFVSKYKIDGTRLWTRLIGSSERDLVKGVTTVGPAGVVATGYVGGRLPKTQYRGGDSDAFLVGIDASGNRSWGRLVGTSATDEGVEVDAERDGTIRATGWTKQSLNGLPYNGGERDGYLMTLTP